MSSAQKIIQAAAGNAAGEATYVEDVFSTYLYTGNGSTQTITNGIDLDAKGGLVWIKGRETSYVHLLTDSTMSRGERLNTASTGGISDNSPYNVTSFNSNGFSLNDISSGVYGVNGSPGGTYSGTNATYASWTFAKQEKFFDVVTYTGTGSTTTIAHSLGSVPGCIITKRTDLAEPWRVLHRGLNTTSGQTLRLNDNAAVQTSSTYFNSTNPTDSVFTVGNDASTNGSGATYVAYLFAHNDGDGIFGETGDQDIIKCGSYTGTGAAGNFVDLGFEPQWVMIKRTNAAADWFILDVMRGASASSYAFLEPNLSDNETSGSSSVVEPKATGFNLNNTGTNHNGSGSTYIYIAIRRGPMKTPESGTEVFDAHYKSGYTFPTTVDTGFVTDAVFHSGTTSAVKGLNARLTTLSMPTYQAFSESSFGTVTFDYSSEQDGFTKSASWGGSGNQLYYSFRRAPGFFDVVAYTGTSASLTLDHNLGVAPELVIMRRRDTTANWAVSLPGHTQYAYLNLTNAAGSGSLVTSTSETQMTIIGDSDFNISGSDSIAYLFATLPGVSKVGSYTGNGTSQTIDCGFSAGARFVLIKRTDSTSNWNVFDAERGIVAGNDPRLELNTIDAQDTGDDGVDPDSSGFAVNYIATNDDDVNVSGGTYIFLAIA